MLGLEEGILGLSNGDLKKEVPLTTNGATFTKKLVVVQKEMRTNYSKLRTHLLQIEDTVTATWKQ